MVWMQHDPDLRLADGNGFDPGEILSVRKPVIGQIQLLTLDHLQVLLHGAFIQVNLALGMLLQKVGENQRRGGIHKGVRHPQPQLLLCRVGEIPRGAFSLLAEQQDLLDPLHKLLALISKDYTLGAALNEFYAKVRF